MHLVALHQHGSNNPLGIDIKDKKDSIPFHPYYTIKDLFGLGVYLLVFGYLVFYNPNYLGHPDNYIPANPMQTPPHIVPEWYFLPFYAILRSVTFDISLGLFTIEAKLGGVLTMFGAVAILFVLPWLDRHPVRSGRFRPVFRIFFWLFVVNALLLGYVGSQPAEGIMVRIGQCCTLWYFFHFLVILPVLSKKEKALPIPQSISAPVLTPATLTPTTVR
jgi:quinol-cytochrome oxidoreductase complex cytochrome b subunit